MASRRAISFLSLGRRIFPTKDSSTHARRIMLRQESFSHARKSVLIHGEVAVTNAHDSPTITVPLPSRRLKSEFVLRPINNTVADLLSSLELEDKELWKTAVYSLDGTRIASSTSIEMLLQEDFLLVLNERHYVVSPPPFKKMTNERIDSQATAKTHVSRMQELLHTRQFQTEAEKRLLVRLQDLKEKLTPFEKKNQEISTAISKRYSVMSWTFLALMAMQLGAVIRLTWWEYSWDVMEPITYFITYGTTMFMYAYFVLTKQDYTFPGVHDRQFLATFYRLSKKHGLDIHRYNFLKNSVAQIEEDLCRLKSTQKFTLPIKEIQKKRVSYEEDASSST